MALRGGPLEHLKHYRDAAKRYEQAIDDFVAAATCRRAFEALQRASESFGEETEEFENLPTQEQNRQAKMTDHHGEDLYLFTQRFAKRCAR